MKLTTDILEEKFDECNKQYFNSELPYPFLGVFSKKRPFAKFTYLIKKKNGKKELLYKKISISDYYDFTEEQLIDILVHEMIHYYIAYNGIKDNKEHGKEFTLMMDRLNNEFGLGIMKTRSTSSYTRKRAND